MGQKNEKKPAYVAIYDALKKEIFSGRLATGDLLPSENKLCSAHNVSRETVRKALKELEVEGFIKSRPKIGYFVCAPNHRDFTVAFSGDAGDYETQYKEIHGILPDVTLQQKLEIPSDKKVIELSQVTYDKNKTPVAYDIKYIPYERAYPSVESEMHFAVLPDLTFSKLTPFSYYINIEIEAAGASEEIAQILQCPKGEPLLLIRRHYIHQEGYPIGYELCYARGPYGKLQGFSGKRL